MNKPHCLRIRGGSEGHLEVDIGEGIDPNHASLVLDYIQESRGIFDHQGQLISSEMHQPFIDRLREHGYDLSTFRLEVYLQGKKAIPARPSPVRQREGVLYSRWGTLHGDVDYCSAYQYPAKREESSVWMNLIIGPSSTKSHFEYRQQRGLPMSFNAGLKALLLDLGFEYRTMRMEVRAFPDTENV